MTEQEAAEQDTRIYEPHERQSLWRRCIRCFGDDPDTISFNFAMTGIGVLAIGGGIMMVCLGVYTLIWRH